MNFNNTKRLLDEYQPKKELTISEFFSLLEKLRLDIGEYPAICAMETGAPDKTLREMIKLNNFLILLYKNKTKDLCTSALLHTYTEQNEKLRKVLTGLEETEQQIRQQLDEHEKLQTRKQETAAVIYDLKEQLEQSRITVQMQEIQLQELKRQIEKTGDQIARNKEEIHIKNSDYEQLCEKRLE